MSTSLLHYYRSSFWIVAAILELARALAHYLRLLGHLPPLDQIPFLVDWIVFAAGLYGGTGFLLFVRWIETESLAERFLQWLVGIHLVAVAFLHLGMAIGGSHVILAHVPSIFSVVAVVFTAWFAWVAATLRFRDVPLGQENG